MITSATFNYCNLKNKNKKNKKNKKHNSCAAALNI